MSKVISAILLFVALTPASFASASTRIEIMERVLAHDTFRSIATRVEHRLGTTTPDRYVTASFTGLLFSPAQPRCPECANFLAVFSRVELGARAAVSNGANTVLPDGRDIKETCVLPVRAAWGRNTSGGQLALEPGNVSCTPARD